MSNLVKNKTFVIPAIASAIIPGLGQLFKGHFLKAIVVWAVCGVIYWIFGSLPVLWIIATVAWIANILDALFSTNSGN